MFRFCMIKYYARRPCYRVALPKFLYDNRTAIGLLAVGIALMNKQLMSGEDKFLPIKQVFWVDFGDHLQWAEKSGHSIINQAYRLPLVGPLKSWQLTQSFYRESLPLVRVYEADFVTCNRYSRGSGPNLVLR